MSEPRFVVVGHVNRGKSSIVSTLAADDSVRVESTPGTTRQARQFPMTVNGRTLYTLVDTPGFERARHVLAWLQEHETSTGERQQTVRQFVEKYEPTGEYEQECRLLQPILDGAAILYVVDGSVPFSPNYEAEMEILRWTAQPRMALINPVGPRNHIDQWRPVLDQYFSMVRLFNAHRSGFRDRIELLRTLRELHDEWRGPLDEAIAVLIEDRRHSLGESAGLIAEALGDMLTAVQEKKLGPDEDPDNHKQPLAERFYQRLRERESKLHESLRQVYMHRELRVESSELQRGQEDLFDLSTWSRLGLSRGQLAAGGGAAGAVVGGGVDAALGGASFLLGAVVGGAFGAASSWLAWGRAAEARVLGQPLGGTLLRIGPVRSPNFPWVVLDRALQVHHVVANRAHSFREAVRLNEPDQQEGVVASLPANQRRELEKLFTRLRKSAGGAMGAGGQREAARGELAQAVERLLVDQESSTTGIKPSKEAEDAAAI